MVFLRYAHHVSLSDGLFGHAAGHRVLTRLLGEDPQPVLFKSHRGCFFCLLWWFMGQHGERNGITACDLLCPHSRPCGVCSPPDIPCVITASSLSTLSWNHHRSWLGAIGRENRLLRVTKARSPIGRKRRIAPRLLSSLHQPVILVYGEDEAEMLALCLPRRSFSMACHQPWLVTYVRVRVREGGSRVIVPFSVSLFRDNL